MKECRHQRTDLEKTLSCFPSTRLIVFGNCLTQPNGKVITSAQRRKTYDQMATYSGMAHSALCRPQGNHSTMAIGRPSGQHIEQCKRRHCSATSKIYRAPGKASNMPLSTPSPFRLTAGGMSN
jgi:hypothetical protein